VAGGNAIEGGNHNRPGTFEKSEYYAESCT
jgi:hypothetical protein